MTAVVRSGADMDADRIYRYSLWRQWGRGRSMVFVMLNPSTADADHDDPTIRRCIGFAKREGYAGIEVVNLFALRTSSPKVLREAHRTGVDIVGERNDEVLARTAAYFDHAVAAWGAESDALVRDRAGEVRAIFGDRLLRFDPTPARGPAPHPLYLKADTPIVAASGSGSGSGSAAGRRRLKVCVEAWPECWTGGFDPRCCRFPKSCSCTVWDDESATEADLEVRGEGS